VPGVGGKVEGRKGRGGIGFGMKRVRDTGRL